MTFRQYQMFEEIKHYPKSYANALELNQLIFGSLCFRRWVEWDTVKEKFIVSQDGLLEFYIHRDWHTHREVNNNKLSVRAARRMKKMWKVA